jgi:hypothetical protein
MAEDNNQNRDISKGATPGSPNPPSPLSSTPPAGNTGAQPQGPAQPLSGQQMPQPPGMPGTPPDQTKKEEKPANFQLGTMLGDDINITLPPHPETEFDDKHFLKLLAASISLSKAEKMRILEAIPKLKQWQVDELINIFEEERKKFAQLSERHVPQLKKLEKQHFEEWKDIEMEQEKEVKSEEDKQKAEEIRKQLGL